MGRARKFFSGVIFLLSHGASTSISAIDLVLIIHGGTPANTSPLGLKKNLTSGSVKSVRPSKYNLFHHRSPSSLARSLRAAEDVDAENKGCVLSVLGGTTRSQ